MAESNVVFIVENDVAPAYATAKPRVGSRKKIPFHQLPGHRDVENAIAFTRKFLCGFQNAPGPWMNFDRAARSMAIHSRDIAGRIVKTHQPLHLFHRGEGAIDIVRRSLTCNLHKRAE